MSQVVKIINYKYRTQPADLIYAAPFGPVQGYHLNLSNNQRWSVVTSIDNLITIQNGSTGTYAVPASERESADVVCGNNEYKWQRIPISGGWYQIATTDGRLAWLLTGDRDYAPIMLKPVSYKGEDAQWSHEPTPLIK